MTKSGFARKAQFLVVCLAAAAYSSAQQVHQWYLQDCSPEIPGSAAVESAYRACDATYVSEPVIVAILDSGVDTEHEDLRNKIWINPGEVEGNGIDDDGNGYVDDIYGWNFLGNAAGENIAHENLEITRLLRQLRQQFSNRSKGEVGKEEKAAWKNWKTLEKEFAKQHQNAIEDFSLMQMVYSARQVCTETVSRHLGKSHFTISEVRGITTHDKQVAESASLLIELYNSGFDEETIREALEDTNNEVEYHLNLHFNPRPEIINDNPDAFSESQYGNADVRDLNGHGTHVAGIVAAERNNGIGTNGVADHVQIMVLRIVPDGDEYDKDIVNAIYYAVNNGARIINMSFGKSYSPHKDKVDKAVQYAASKGVIIVHAAGNDALDIDKNPSYPDAVFQEGKDRADNFLEVGASTSMSVEYILADFSNYGKAGVDIFAPGQEIYSTFPGNGYKAYDGTSEAAPVVSGMLAAIWAVYPEKDYREIINILLASGTDFSDVKVYQPSEGGKRKKIPFSKVCTSGKIANLNNALRYAADEL